MDDNVNAQDNNDKNDVGYCPPQREDGSFCTAAYDEEEEDSDDNKDNDNDTNDDGAHDSGTHEGNAADDNDKNNDYDDGDSDVNSDDAADRFTERTWKPQRCCCC